MASAPPIGRNSTRVDWVSMDSYVGWLACFLITGACVLGCGSVPRDNPLVGTWVSDKQRTLEEIEKKPTVTARTRGLVDNDFFGKLRVSYDYDTYTSEFEGEIIRGKYRVLEVKKDFIEIEEQIEGWDKRFRSKIYFDGDYMYIESNKHDFREYFRKLE